MTKEEVFDLLDNTISHIGKHFSAEEREAYLDDVLFDAVLPFEFSIDSGISKAVILIKEASFVIKLPFFCLFEQNFYDEAIADWEADKEDAIQAYAKKKIHETGDSNYILSLEEIDTITEVFEEEHPEPNAEDYYYETQGASNIDLGGEEDELSDWNYCALEVAIYERAKAEGVADYFAEEGYLGTIDNTPVYYQMRCTPMADIDHDYNSAAYSRKKTSAEKTCENLKMYCFNPIWIADFIEMYGEDELKRLHDFLNKYEIDDLRECNIGYLDGAPILFDYSGYREW